MTLTSEEGKRWQFNAGDAWVIPAGFKGTWESIEPARKRYAIFEAAKPRPERVYSHSIPKVMPTVRGRDGHTSSLNRP